MVPLEPFDVTQVQVAQAKAPVTLIMRQPNQPISYEAIVTTEFCLIAIAGLAYAKCRYHLS